MNRMDGTYGTSDETVRCLTAHARGAIAVIRIDARLRTLRRLPLSTLPLRVNRPKLVRWLDHVESKTYAEEIVVRRLPDSDRKNDGDGEAGGRDRSDGDDGRGEDISSDLIGMELSCHGGLVAVRR
ncbi:MAG: hypothetical protein Q4C47_06945, partial [Planctomycetia bacterium]|nr:hypothetical protein [Planctomycetia bacterium]